MNINENSAMGTEKQEEREIPFPTIGFDTKFRKISVSTDIKEKPYWMKSKVVYEHTKGADDTVIMTRFEAGYGIYPVTIQIGNGPAKRVVLDSADIVILWKILQENDPYLAQSIAMGEAKYERYQKEQVK